MGTKTRAYYHMGSQGTDDGLLWSSQARCGRDLGKWTLLPIMAAWVKRGSKRFLVPDSRLTWRKEKPRAKSPSSPLVLVCMSLRGQRNENGGFSSKVPGWQSQLATPGAPCLAQLTSPVQAELQLAAGSFSATS